MIKVENFDDLLSSGISYGGHGGSKKGILIENEKWFLKYPKSTKSMEVENLSYITTPLSEYLGSHIYEILGIDVHKTKLGIANGKVVVACRDFLKSSEIILDYNAIKNEYDEIIEQELEKLSSSSSSNTNTDLEEILLIMNKNKYFKAFPELKSRFWDMFIVDAFIGNHDRNEGNWGLILDKEMGELRLTPVFDNGAAFYNKSANSKLEDIYADSFKFKQVVYDSSLSIFRKNNKPINPLKYIESMENTECNAALIRIMKNLDMDKIRHMFNEIPSEIDGLPILSEMQKLFYIKTLEYRYANVFVPTYNKILNKNN